MEQVLLAWRGMMEDESGDDDEDDGLAYVKWDESKQEEE